MVVLNLHKIPLQIQYKNTIISKASFFVFFVKFICLIIPFIVAYRSKGFWLKQDEFYEQPDIKFRGEYFFAALTTNLNKPIFSNNIPELRTLNDLDLISELSAREVDFNHDKKIDEFEFSAKMELPFHGRLILLTLIVPIDYTLHTLCPLHMQSGIIIQKQVADYINEMQIIANLELAQTTPLYCYSRGLDNRYNYSIFNEINNEQSMESMMNAYAQRNITTYMTNELITYKFSSSKDYSNFKLNVKVKYKQHRILYKPGFWQVMKWAWIQYFSIYVIFSWCFNCMINYVFTNKLLLFYEKLPIKQ